MSISIVVASLYFLISPLRLSNPTELLARTRPTIYDVLIALFGGATGMLENARKERGTVLSGVAIATIAVAKFLGFKSVATDEFQRRRNPRIVALLLLIIIVPSVITAIGTIRDLNNHYLNTIQELNKRITELEVELAKYKGAAQAAYTIKK